MNYLKIQQNGTCMEGFHCSSFPYNAFQMYSGVIFTAK